MNGTLDYVVFAISLFGAGLFFLRKIIAFYLAMVELGRGLWEWRDVLDFTLTRRLRGKKKRRVSPATNNWLRARPKLPSLSQGLVSLAEHRLPAQMNVTDKQRWGKEMRADVAWQPRRRRLWIAFNAWRKASQIPVAAAGAARSARD